jgi:pimeloyl-ACP methyl ester carboxylesterase
MRSYPVFAPHGDGCIAAVVTLPDREPRGVVLVLRLIHPFDLAGSGTWPWLSRVLAERGIASIRLDYEGFGDSTTAPPTLGLGNVTEHANEARAVLRAVDGEAAFLFGVVGWCHDGLVALELTNDTACVGAVCMNTPVVLPTARSAVGRRAARTRLAGFVRERTTLRRLLGYERMRTLLRDRPDRHVRRAVDEALEAERVLFLRNQRLWELEGFAVQNDLRVGDDEPTILEPHSEREQPTAEEEASLVRIADWFAERFDVSAALRRTA